MKKVDIASKLFPFDIPILIAHLIASCFLFFCLVFLLYKPFQKWMNLRAQKEQKTLKNLNYQLTAAKSKHLLAEQKLHTTQKFILKMVTEKRKELNEERMEILKEVHKSKKTLLTNAQVQIQENWKKAENDIQKAIIINAITLTEKILKTKINPKDHQKMIDDFIKKIDV